MTMSDSYEELADQDLLVKSTHLAYFRMGFALVSLSLGWIMGRLDGVEAQPLDVVWVAAAVIVYTGFALVVLRFTDGLNRIQLKFLNAVLIAFDIFTLSALVHLTRGIDSDLYLLYLLPIVLASHIFGRRGIFVTAVAASSAYLVTLLIENYTFIPYLVGGGSRTTLAAAYSQRLWGRILTRSAMLVGISFVWALFCEHMSQVAQQGATRLRGQLDANNALMSETRAHAAREQLINTVSSAIRSTLDVDLILSTTVKQLSAALGASRCAIITPSEDSAEQPPALWEAMADGDQQHGHETRFSRSFCQFILDRLSNEVVAENGDVQKTFIYENPLAEPLFAEVKTELASLHLKSVLAQPIMYGLDSKGVLVIGECEKSRIWSHSELVLVKAVAGQVAIAIEHGRVVAQLSRKNKDLLQKNLNLDSKNLELRTIQSQLIHQEKMASLGRMVAGIAHELNNPVNFVHGNLPYLRAYFEDLKAVVDSLQSVPEEYRGTTEELKRKVKYDFMVIDLDNIIADLNEGSERIRQIIKNLRSFSRLDEAELKEASIQEGIESTIKILNQYYGRDKIQAQIRFAELPAVICYPGKLNQVWMNLLSNAAQAVAQRPDPQVKIETELVDQWVIVSIADNGTGIKAADQSKIFEPFYTTKPVGQGTGLGLSICHSIIERHGGKIWFETELGSGTTFKVKIPLRPLAENENDDSEPVILTPAIIADE